MAYTTRQKNEISYHKEHSEKNRNIVNVPVDLDVVNSKSRRWWNPYWSLYSRIRDNDLKDKRVLVPGCGFGKDAIRIAALGAEVYAFDISPDIVSLTEERLKKFGIKNVYVSSQASEATNYESSFFDAAVFVDILHHVDIPATCQELNRVLKPGGLLIGNELYTHNVIEGNFRQSAIVRALYPRMQNYIYQGQNPYITADEHKIDETEFRYITELCDNMEIQYYYTFAGRVFPDAYDIPTKIDRMVTASIGRLGRFTAGRVVFSGNIRKQL